MSRPIAARLFRKGRTYYVSYWMDGKRIRISTGSMNRKVAEEFRKEKEREMILGHQAIVEDVSNALCDPRRRDRVLEAIESEHLTKVDEALSQYLEQSKIHKRPKTISTDRGRLVSFFKWVNLEHVNDIRTSHVSDYIAFKSASVGPTTLLRIREILHAFYEHLIAQGDLKNNPIKGVPRPQIHEKDIE
ncbi:MAG: hypothetical protein QF645_09590, partial [Planctomycetota bacterium]|nr:hypothetical protein [Planctomycetota bacterium]